MKLQRLDGIIPTAGDFAKRFKTLAHRVDVNTEALGDAIDAVPAERS